MRETIAAVESVLREIGVDDAPSELVLNKVDLLDPAARRRLEDRFPGAPQVSAATGEGLDALRERISELFSGRFEEVRLLVPHADVRALADLYALGAPIDERADTDDGVFIRARLPQRDLRRFARYLVASSGTPTAGR